MSNKNYENIDKILDSLNKLCAGEITNGITASSITMNRQCARELVNYIYDLNTEIDRLRNEKVVPESHIEQTFNTKLTNLKCDSMGSVLRFEFEKLKEEILK